MRSSDGHSRFGGIGPASVALLKVAIVPALAANDAPPTPQDLANTEYECATAMAYSESLGEEFRFHSRVLFFEFDALERKHGISRDVAAAYAKQNFETLTAGMSQSRAEDYIVDLAFDCEDLAIEREGQRILAQQEKDGETGTEIDVAFLRDHFAANRNPRVIVDYIVDRHPGGKGLTGDPIPEGEYLGELLVQIGALGLQAISDGALAAIISGPYWQYNPAASRLADGEYRRRMRVQKFNQRDAKEWAQRVVQERRNEMLTAANRTSERWGAANVRCTNVAPQGLEGKSYTSCRVLDKYGQ